MDYIEQQQALAEAKATELHTELILSSSSLLSWTTSVDKENIIVPQDSERTRGVRRIDDLPIRQWGIFINGCAAIDLGERVFGAKISKGERKGRQRDFMNRGFTSKLKWFDYLKAHPDCIAAGWTNYKTLVIDVDGDGLEESRQIMDEIVQTYRLPATVEMSTRKGYHQHFKREDHGLPRAVKQIHPKADLIGLFRGDKQDSAWTTLTGSITAEGYLYEGHLIPDQVTHLPDDSYQLLKERLLFFPSSWTTSVLKQEEKEVQDTKTPPSLPSLSWTTSVDKEENAAQQSLLVDYDRDPWEWHKEALGKLARRTKNQVALLRYIKDLAVQYPGEIILGQYRASEETGIPRPEVSRILKKFREQGIIWRSIHVGKNKYGKADRYRLVPCEEVEMDALDLPSASVDIGTFQELTSQGQGDSDQRVFWALVQLKNSGIDEFVAVEKVKDTPLGEWITEERGDKGVARVAQNVWDWEG
ncbi:hypothetical protein [Nocardiopsis sp. NPDC006938]|uniref:hypothetical protein n=1 Tax=Nocardiopsis sp. NPDC006938 TaxID=3364337 RepID=UPI0036B6A0DD